MTKEKLAIKLAIDIMERNVSKYINHGIYEVSDTDGAVHVEFGEAINILNEMLEQKPCEDAVSRQTVLGMMQMKMGGKELYEAVYDLPSVTPIRPKGKWIETVDEETAFSKTWHYECSKCGKHNTCLSGNPNFCPHCGADMRGEKE